MEKSWSGDETVLEVPLELMDHPLGFTLDAGGSVTKVMYRSREDFVNGKPTKGQEKGTLRLRCSNMGHYDDLLNFLSENCDLAHNHLKSDVYQLTGITTTHFKTKLEECFHVRTELMSEMKAIECAVLYADKLGLKCHKASEHVYHSGLYAMRLVLNESKQKEKDILKNDPKNFNLISPQVTGEGSNSISRPPSSPALDLLICKEPKVWMERHMIHEGPIKGPALLVLAGSAVVAHKIDKGGGLETLDFLEIGGKTLCGMAEQMIGVKDFDELMDMASRGSSSKVNTTISDLGSSRHKENDWYTTMDQNIPTYFLGKLSSCRIKGRSDYSREDLAAGLVDTVAKVISKFSLLNARLHQLETVYVCGSLARYEVVRSALEGHFAMDAVFANVAGKPFIRIFCMENPGFICAFGAWVKNVEDERKRRNK